METTINFISAEKLGVLFVRIEDIFRNPKKKSRAANLKWVRQTLQQLGLVPFLGDGWNTTYITIGCDQSGNYGVVVVQEHQLVERPNVSS